MWRWTDERGVQRLVGTDELKTALSTGVLRPTTLVWRDGMKEWAPASTIAELASLSGSSGKHEVTRSNVNLPRNATLIGLSSPNRPTPGKLALEVPASGNKPRADLPAPPAPRKPATSEIDEGWANTTHSDEDETIPGRARPEQLAAAAAAARAKKTTNGPKHTLPGGVKVPSLPAAPQAGEGRRPTLKMEGATPPPAPAAPDRAKEGVARVPGPVAEAIAPKAPVVLKGPSGKPPPLPPRAKTTTRTLTSPLSGANGSAVGPLSNTVPAASAPAPEAAKVESSTAGLPVAPPRGELPSFPDPLLEAAQEPAGAEAGGALPSFPDPSPAAPKPFDRPEVTDLLPSFPLSATASGVLAVSLTEPEAARVASSARVPSSRPPPAPPARAAAQSLTASSHVAPPPSSKPPPPTPLIALAPPPSNPPPAGEAKRDPIAETAPMPPVKDNGTARSYGLPAVTAGDARSAPSRTLDDDPIVLPKPGSVAVPLSSLLGAGGVLIGMVVTAFFFGRASVGQAPGVALPLPMLGKRGGAGAVESKGTAASPSGPLQLKPCWMVKQPIMWAPKASTIPFEVQTTKGNKLSVGYARSAKEAVGIEVDPQSGAIAERFSEKEKGKIERVVVSPSGEFKVTLAGAEGPLKGPIEVLAAEPFTVGIGANGIALSQPPGSAPRALWPLTSDDALAAASVTTAGDKGYLLTYRRDDAIWSGFLGPDKKPLGDLVKVVGSGGAVGRPLAGWNGKEVAVIYADRPASDAPYEIRVGRAPAGAPPGATKVIPLPKGGPGGDAFAPDIAGLPDGRWLLVWTEGSSGKRAVRAQTLTPELSPLGDPIALSPPAGNFGQGIIGVAGGYAAIVFLSKPSSAYELWGTVLQCG